jgi:hypothetical protein
MDPTLSLMPSNVRDNTALSRFELNASGVIAFMNYRLGDGVITLDHTETPPQARGRGLASPRQCSKSRGPAALKSCRAARLCEPIWLNMWNFATS